MPEITDNILDSGKPEKVTPMMAQYLGIKADHPDDLLFYRMGDFFELFFADAVKAAAALDLTLTRRGHHDGEDIPMCGVPVHAHEAYLARLIKKGFRVAIAEQVETPEQARRRDGHKALVRRAVVRVVTPGTLTEDSLLEARAANYLAVLVERGGRMALAWADVSTGELQVETVDAMRLAGLLARLEPQEIVLPEGVLEKSRETPWVEEWQERLTPLPSSRFDHENGQRRLLSLFGVATLDGFGDFEPMEIAALGALADYLHLTQCGQMPVLRMPVRGMGGAVMEIDAATRRSLELTRTQQGDRAGSLLAAIDLTITAAGARLLAQRLAAPLTDPVQINQRLDMIAIWVAATPQRLELRETLRACPDLERAISRLSLDRGGPRDLAAIRDALRVAAQLQMQMANHPGATDDPVRWAAMASLGRQLGDHAVLIDRLARALADELPLLSRDGGFIRSGYHDQLDHFQNLQRDGRQVIAALQARYIDQTGVNTLKIRHNNILGYYIEVSAQQAPRLQTPEMQAIFIHRQSMSNATRFTTTELADLEREIAAAADKALALELELFADLRGEILGRIATIEKTALALAALDVSTALAQLAIEYDYTRPDIDTSRNFVITGGRHLVVEIALKKQGGHFVANDADLGPSARLWLLTGPNMAGKSTFLRQNALIAIMAQMGSFVPARQARIGVIDRLFSRVGAADDLARGRSTFMVEMVEAAAILNQATEQSLVILDEIGRGTATYDGLSIAWACLEHLHNVNRCRGVFATHYHELTALADTLAALRCYRLKIREWQDQVIFLHEVGPGIAERSFGLHVARLAGLPAAVIDRAGQVLQELEQERPLAAPKSRKKPESLPLFEQSITLPKPSPALIRLQSLEADSLTPRAALDLVYELTAMVRQDG